MRSVTLGVLLAASLVRCSGEGHGAATPVAPAALEPAQPTPPAAVPALDPGPTDPAVLPPAGFREPFTGCEWNGELPAPTPASASVSCRGLPADLPEPRSTEFSVCSAWQCGEPLGSASGTLAARVVAWSYGAPSGMPTELFTWRGDGDGAARRAAVASLGALHALPSGFAFVEANARGWFGDLQVVADDASAARSIGFPWGSFAHGPWHSTVDAEGRLVMAAVVSASSTSGPFDLQVSRVDPVSGEAEGPVSVLYLEAGQPILGLGPLAHTSAVNLGVDLAGRILVLWDGEWSCGPGTVGGRWLGPDLVPLGPAFVAAHKASEASVPLLGELETLLDGTLVLRSATWGTYTRRFESGLPAGGEVPSWLSQPGFGDVVRLPGDRGYARLPLSKIEVSPGVCVAGLEVLAPGGNRCGTLRLGPAEACSRWSPEMLGAIAGDGTVVRRLADCPSPDAAWTCCRYAWWPQLLAP